MAAGTYIQFNVFFGQILPSSMYENILLKFMFFNYAKEHCNYSIFFDRLTACYKKSERAAILVIIVVIEKHKLYNHKTISRLWIP